ncbi:MAG TPA: YIP1 family protein [Bacteroidales bacterium]|nr:YIP1 family protein [Bacteroidales bacterium]
MSNESFDINEFVKESKDVLVNPNYFSTMKTAGGMTEPLIKAVIYGAIAGVFTFLWSVLHVGPLTGGLFGGAIGVMAFIWAVIGAVIGLFIGGVIVLVLSAICKGNTDFEANVRVTAAVMIVMPISAALGFLSGINLYLGTFVTLAVNIFALWLTYKGLVQALKAKPDTARIVLYVCIAIFVLFMLVGMGARRKANQFMNDFNSSDLKELMEEAPKN